MKDVGNTLFADLMALCDLDDGFYFVDQEVGEEMYRVFSYRMVSYTRFHELPNALNCRGTTFLMTRDGRPVYLASLPPHKFFNLHEGGMNEVIDYENDVAGLMVKEDGSLISTYYSLRGEIGFKSKTSFKSTMAVAAQEYYDRNPTFASYIDWLTTEYDCTVNMEWVAPDNQIVVPYVESKLVILNVRTNAGPYLHRSEIEAHAKGLWVDYFEPEDKTAFINDIVGMNADDSDTLIEGFVLQMHDGGMIKVKTDRYCRLHHTKDNISNAKRLFEIVLRQEHDDLLALLAADPISVDRIKHMEEFVIPIYNKFIMTCELYYANNKHLTQKEYAIKGMADLTRVEFSYVMSLYNKKLIDLLNYMCKNAESLLGDYEYVSSL